MTLWKCTQIPLAVWVMAIQIYSLASANEDPLFLAANEVPEGFEILSAPQRSLVDIYYGNRYLTSQLVTFEPGKLTLSNPDEVIRLIGSINDPAFIRSALSSELNSNADQLCLPNQTQDCGILNPPVAGVIFDEGRFRADIFINPRFLLTRAADVRKFLPPSDADFSLMQNFSAALSGSTQQDTEDDYTVNGLTLLSYKENSLYWSWDYAKEQSFSVNQLYGQREFEGIEYAGGLLYSQAFGLNFTSDQPMLGVRLETSTNTRTDTDFSGGVPIEVFMPLRGRVEIRRDGRLIASFFHEAGLQQLDTSGFPSGAYDIEIRILDEQGNEQSRQTQFFAKQYQLPPEGEWRYFAEGGQVVDRAFDGTFPETTSQWLGRAGVSRRLSDTVSGTAAFASMGSDNLLELGLYNLGYRYELSPSLMATGNGDYGFTVNGRTWINDVSLSANYRRLWRNDDTLIVNDESEDLSLLGEGFEQSSVSMSAPLWNGSINYRFNSSQSAENDATRSHSVDYRATLFRSTDYDTSFQLSFSESEGNKIALFSLEWRYRNDRWNFRANPRAEIQNTNGVEDRSESVRLSADWDDGDLYDGNLSFNAGVESASGQKRLDGGVQYANHYGRADFSFNHSQAFGSNDVTSYVGSFSTSFLTDGDVVAMGGEERAESAVVININGRDGDVFDVEINGSRRGYAVVGQPSVIPLSPFEEYRITLSPSGDSFYSFDEREKSFTLYPGNVLTLDYDAIALQILFGRLLFNGEPLEGARVTGGLYPANTDGVGLFQLEARSDVNSLQVELANGWLCTMDVSPDNEKNVLRIGTVDLAEAECVPQLEGQLAISKRDDP